MSKPVAVVAGVGPGIGAAVARKFAAAGYAVALLARRQEILTAFEVEIAQSRGFVCDVGSEASVTATFADIRAEWGEVDTLIFNAGASAFGDVETVTPAQFESAWRINALGGFLCAREVIPAMKAAGRGSIIFTGATASRRGGPRSAAFGPAKAAQRSLAESMARSLWPAGVHVGLVIVDGVVDLARTRRAMPDKPDSFFIKPDDVAQTIFQLTQQNRSAWSFEVEARPFGESW